MSIHRCPTCGRDFRGRLGLGVHQARSKDCKDPAGRRRLAREREARYRARHPERRREQLREARRRLLERRPDYFRKWRLEHADQERARQQRWRREHLDQLREQRRRRAERRRVGETPLPPSHAHHPLFEQAWDVLRRLNVRRDDHLAVIRDTRWEEACSEAVLAILEGRDAEAAARAVLAQERRYAALHRPVGDIGAVRELAA